METSEESANMNIHSNVRGWVRPVRMKTADVESPPAATLQSGGQSGGAAARREELGVLRALVSSSGTSGFHNLYFYIYITF